jgi:hypothetical protein
MKLIFVYNADSGYVSTLLDIGHKIVNPETYSCNLCQMTFDTFSENKKWKEFRESSAIDMEFLHRDEFEEKYDMKLDYPVVLRDQHGMSPYGNIVFEPQNIEQRMSNSEVRMN